MVDLSERFDCFQFSVKNDAPTVVIQFCYFDKSTLKEVFTHVFRNFLIYMCFNLRIFFYRSKSIISFTQYVLTGNSLHWTNGLCDW